MARVALDADVVIAFLNARDPQHERAVAVLRPVLAAGDEILVSASAYAEVMVRPLALGNEQTVEEFLQAVGANVVPIGTEIARRAAELRARHRALRLPDALTLAAALESDAQLLTLDQRLRRVIERAG